MKKKNIKRFAIAINLTIVLLLVAFIYFPGVFVNGIGNVFDLQRIGNIPSSGVFTYASYHCIPIVGSECESAPNAQGTTDTGFIDMFCDCTAVTPACDVYSAHGWGFPKGHVSGVSCSDWNADCGTTVNFTSGEYCYGANPNVCCLDDDTAICNPGWGCGPLGMCDVSLGLVLHIEDMDGQLSCPGTESSWSAPYCSVGDVYRDRTVTPGICSIGACGTGTPYTENDLVEDCGVCGCSGASCVDSSIKNCSNDCGGTWQCDSSECTLDPPGYDTPCNSEPNESCGETAPGFKQCDGTCSADPPPPPDGYGDPCESLPNSCGMTNIGNIDCSGGCSEDTPSNSLCNNPPAAIVDLVLPGDACGVSTPSVIMSWTFTDPDTNDSQTAYHIRISREGAVIHNSGQIQTSSQQYAPPLGTFLYGIVYTWEIKVWDSFAPPANSAWIAGTGFVTPPHQSPVPSFTWSPQTPGEDEAVTFTDTSTAYDDDGTIDFWSWTFEDGTPASSSQQSPIVLFSSIGSKLVTLEVTDSDGISCASAPQNVGIGVPFPEWEEIPPFGIELIDFFVALFTP